jgi:N-methylhydantoinase A
VQTHVALADALDPAAVTSIFDALSARAREALTKEGFAESEHSFVRTADLRYFGQAFEVRVSVPEGDVDAGVLDDVAALFHAEHRALYGYDFAGDATQQVEWVNLRVSGIGPIQRPEIKKAPLVEEGAPAPVSKPRKSRLVCFEQDGYVDTPVLWRPDLAPGTTISGPAIIEEFGSTVPLHPGFDARIDEYLNIIVTRSN